MSQNLALTPSSPPSRGASSAQRDTRGAHSAGQLTGLGAGHAVYLHEVDARWQLDLAARSGYNSASDRPARRTTLLHHDQKRTKSVRPTIARKYERELRPLGVLAHRLRASSEARNDRHTGDREPTGLGGGITLREGDQSNGPCPRAGPPDSPSYAPAGRVSR